jgi:ubiquinone/menaquinone biosynthesis C-methylase UbiE
MVEDKSLFHYGWLYPEGSKVLDLACGTGELCFALRKLKNCKVSGVDLSSRMIDFAKKSNPYDDVKFFHADATNLAIFRDNSFDYSTILLLLHELTKEKQVEVLNEALRVSKRVITIDSNVPLPKNFQGVGIRLVEATFGHDHNGNFKSFLKKYGITGILKNLKKPFSIEINSVFKNNCREFLMISNK